MINPIQEDEEGTTVLTSSQQEHAGTGEPLGQPNAQIPGAGISPDQSDLMIRKKGEKKGMSKGAKAALIIIPILIVIAIAVLAVIYVPKFS